MQCMLFGDKITFAPNIKNWWQAIALGGANYIGGIMEGMMAGAAVGMGGAFIGGARTAFLQGGTRAVGQAGLNFLKVMPKNFGVNLLESVSKFGLAMRGIMGAQNTAATYGNTGTASIGDFAQGTVAMETGAYDSFNNIKEGKGTWQDYVGMAMMVAPVGQGKRDLEAEMTRKADDAEGKKADEESTKKATNQEGESAKKEGVHEAFEADPIKPKKGGAHKDLDFDNSIAEGKKVETVEQRHHMPSQNSGNKGGNGGAITMETLDHKKTASYDNLEGSKDYRAKQTELVEQGKFNEAFEMDVKDVKDKFGNKYDDAIEELTNWYKETGKF